MPHYFFDFYDGVQSVDDEGVTLPDLKRARLEALRLTGAIIRDHPERFEPDQAWRVDIRTGDQGVLARIGLTTSLECVSDPISA